MLHVSYTQKKGWWAFAVTPSQFQVMGIHTVDSKRLREWHLMNVQITHKIYVYYVQLDIKCIKYIQYLLG